MVDNGEKVILKRENRFFRWLTPSLLVLVGTLLINIFSTWTSTLDEMQKTQREILATQRVTNEKLSALSVDVQANRRDIDRHERVLTK